MGREINTDRGRDRQEDGEIGLIPSIFWLARHHYHPSSEAYSAWFCSSDTPRLLWQSQHPYRPPTTMDLLAAIAAMFAYYISLFTGSQGGHGGDSQQNRHGPADVDVDTSSLTPALVTINSFPSDTNIHLQHICRLLVSLNNLDPGTTAIRLRVTPASELGLPWPMLPHELLGLSLDSPEFVSSSSSKASSLPYRRQAALVKDAWHRRAAHLSWAEPELESDDHHSQPHDSANPDWDQDSLLSLTSWSASVLMEPLLWLAYRDLVVTSLQKPPSLSFWSSLTAWGGEILQGEEARREKLRALCRDFS